MENGFFRSCSPNFTKNRVGGPIIAAIIIYWLSNRVSERTNTYVFFLAIAAEVHDGDVVREALRPDTANVANYGLAIHLLLSRMRNHARKIIECNTESS